MQAPLPELAPVSPIPLRPMRLLPLVLALGLAACARTTEPPAPDTDAPPGDTASAMPVRVDVRYACDGGREVLATYPTDSTALVAFDDRTHEMRLAVSDSGARYASPDLEWWTRGTGPGSEATVFAAGTDGTTGARLAACTESPRTDTMAAPPADTASLQP